jgi:ABC-type antimicrobial peptide transport system permease subunit
MREIVLLVGSGIAIGIPMTLLGSRLIENMLFGLRGTDTMSLAGSVALLLAIALLAGYFPAQRASKVDPMIALRYE